MPDRPDIQVVYLDSPEIPLDVLEVLVDLDDSRRVRDIRGDSRADYVDPVEGGLGRYLLLVTAKAETAVADLPEEMLPDLVLPDDLPHPYPDLVRVFQPARRS